MNARNGHRQPRRQSPRRGTRGAVRGRQLGNVPLVHSCSLETPTVGANETVSAAFEASNTGDEPGPWAVGAEVDGAGEFVAITESSSTVSPGETVGASIEFVPADVGLGAGEHVLTLQWADEASNLNTTGTGIACGTVTVGGQDGQQAGLPIVPLGIGAAVVVLAWRRFG